MVVKPNKTVLVWNRGRDNKYTKLGLVYALLYATKVYVMLIRKMIPVWRDKAFSGSLYSNNHQEKVRPHQTVYGLSSLNMFLILLIICKHTLMLLYSIMIRPLPNVYLYPLCAHHHFN